MHLTCVRCGSAFAPRPGGGRQPARCPDCRVIGAEKPPREAPCIDCGVIVRPAGKTGSVPQRCPECRTAFYNRKRQVGERAAFACADCGVEIRPTRPTGVPPKRCVPCAEAAKRLRTMEARQRWIEANPERNKEHARKHRDKRKLDPNYLQYRRDGVLRRSYGLTRSEFDAMSAAQSHACAICQSDNSGRGSKPTRLHIDHNHETGATRGLLCGNCNTALGLFADDIARLEQAISYLRLHGET